jgi:hypothetical protein
LSDCTYFDFEKECVAEDMAYYNQDDGYPWGNSSSNRPPLTHRFSSISDMSSGSSSHRNSVISLPSPTSEGHRSSPYDEVDVSHVRLYSTGRSSVASPTDSSTGRYNRASMELPDTLRVGTPGTPPVPSGALPETLRVGTPPTPATRSFNPFNRTPSISYEPVARGEGGSRSRTGSRRYSAKRKPSLLGSSAIPEGEEIDMSLLGSATPMGLSSHRTGYSSVAEDDREDELSLSPTGGASFDISSFTGPMNPENEAQLREIEKQERGGILTGGLGAGWKPDTTIRSTDLYASAPQTPSTPISPPSRGLSRRMSSRIPFRGPALARAPTLRALGQSEANKRGEIIQVIVEEEPTVDLSTFEGGNTRTATVSDFDQLSGSKQARRETLHVPSVEVFYPQANWRPFSMRWPYLTALIALSVTLAATEEYLLQKSLKEPLFRFKTAEELKTWDYFTFKYLPTLCAVTFGVLWQVTDFEVKRLEAFYQLSREGGALAAESINVDYITFFNFLRPVRALRYKHYAVAVSSVATLMAVSLTPTLQSASIKLRKLDPEGWKEIHIDPIFSRLLSSFLIVIAILGCVLVWQLQRRRSGLVADVKGIAGIAAMANRSHILMDFKNMDTATPEMIHQKLKTHRYLLRNSSLAPEDKVPLTQEEKDKYDQEVHAQNPHPLMLRLIAGIPFLIGMVLFIIFIPIVLFQRDVNVLTDKAPWLLTVLAVCIKLAWGTLETDVRMIEPFYILSKRHASPKVLTLDYTAMAFGWMPIRAFLNGHFLVGLVGLGSVLAELLTVCSTSFANVSGNEFARDLAQRSLRRAKEEEGVNAGEETVKSFWISFGLAISILSFLCLVAVFVYARRRHPFLPRQPNTISSVLAFIHQSKMLYDFVGTEKMNNDEMVKRLVGIKKTYGLGWFTGRDGELHCGVDEEELVSNYRHGEDTRKANMISGGVGNWENY